MSLGLSPRRSLGISRELHCSALAADLCLKVGTSLNRAGLALARRRPVKGKGTWMDGWMEGYDFPRFYRLMR